VTKGHGRIERRTLGATTFAAGYAAGDGRRPGLAQLLRLERRRTVAGRTTVEVAYAITSLGPRQAEAARRLALCRGHWSIENRLFWVRDAALGEDRCRVRSGGAAQVLAALRNVAVGAARQIGRGMTAAARRWNIHPFEAVALLKGQA
jgi:hypothetical protein